MARMNVSLPDALYGQVNELKEAGININVSAVFQKALEQEVREVAIQQQLTKDIERIEVDMFDEEGRRWVKTFNGRWLVHPDDDVRSDQPGADAGIAYGVALTKKGNIAMYASHVNEGQTPSFEVYGSLDDAEADDWPEDIVGMAREELTGERWVEELDI